MENDIVEKRRPPSLGKIGKSTSADARVTRASLIRSGSQEDPVQLLRDLQDSIEREADLREQLKFAEEEVSVGCITYFVYPSRSLSTCCGN